MLFSALFSLSLAGLSFAAPPIAAYNAEAGSELSSSAAVLADSTVTALLDVIWNYGLQEDYGVYSLHEHLEYANGEAPYEVSGNSTYAVTAVVDYSTISADSVPTIYGIDVSTAQLIPIEYISADTVSASAESALATAISAGIIADILAVVTALPAAEQKVVGLGLLTTVAQAALADPSKAVLVSASPADNTKVSKLVSLNSIDAEASAAGATSTVEPTLYAYSNSTTGPHILMWCFICGGINA